MNQCLFFRILLKWWYSVCPTSRTHLLVQISHVDIISAVNEKPIYLIYATAFSTYIDKHCLRSGNKRVSFVKL